MKLLLLLSLLGAAAANPSEAVCSKDYTTTYQMGKTTISATNDDVTLTESADGVIVTVKENLGIIAWVTGGTITHGELTEVCNTTIAADVSGGDYNFTWKGATDGDKFNVVHGKRYGQLYSNSLIKGGEAHQEKLCLAYDDPDICDDEECQWVEYAGSSVCVDAAQAAVLLSPDGQAAGHCKMIQTSAACNADETIGCRWYLLAGHTEVCISTVELATFELPENQLLQSCYNKYGTQATCEAAEAGCTWGAVTADVSMCSSMAALAVLHCNEFKSADACTGRLDVSGATDQEACEWVAMENADFCTTQGRIDLEETAAKCYALTAKGEQECDTSEGCAWHQKYGADTCMTSTFADQLDSAIAMPMIEQKPGECSDGMFKTMAEAQAEAERCKCDVEKAHEMDGMYMTGHDCQDHSGHGDDHDHGSDDHGSGEFSAAAQASRPSFALAIAFAGVVAAMII